MHLCLNISPIEPHHADGLLVTALEVRQDVGRSLGSSSIPEAHRELFESTGYTKCNDISDLNIDNPKASLNGAAAHRKFLTICDDNDMRTH